MRLSIVGFTAASTPSVSSCKAAPSGIVLVPCKDGEMDSVGAAPSATSTLDTVQCTVQHPHGWSLKLMLERQQSPNPI